VTCSGGDIVNLMMAEQVVWHTNCKHAVDNKKVQRARDRKNQEEAVLQSPVKTRRTSSCGRKCVTATTSSLPQKDDTATCIFCNQTGNKKHLLKAATLGLDKSAGSSAQKHLGTRMCWPSFRRETWSPSTVCTTQLV
jgi:hypothetical protein